MANVAHKNVKGLVPEGVRSPIISGSKNRATLCAQTPGDAHLDEFDSIRIKRRVKLALEELQERVKIAERLHKRPPLSDVVSRLLEANQQAMHAQHLAANE